MRSPIVFSLPKRTHVFLLVTVLVASMLLLGVSVSAAWVQIDTVEKASVDSSETQGNGDSEYASLSASGRFVAFQSVASNLVPGDTNGRRDVFVRDLVSGDTTRASVATDGSQDNRNSQSPSIDGNGRYVAFSSGARNLVPGDTNGRRDIFVRDLASGETTRVSIATGGAQANDRSNRPSISTDGRYVAFESDATNLVSGDTNGLTDIFLHDMVTGSTVRLSVDTLGGNANGASIQASLDGDGSVVVFRSTATDLVVAGANGADDIYARDIGTGITVLVSQTPGGVSGNGISVRPSISDDGTMVSFESLAEDLVVGDSNSREDVFVRSLVANATIIVSLTSDGAQADLASQNSRISGDARFVVFNSQFAFDPADTNTTPDVYLRDLLKGQTDRVSTATDGTEADAGCINGNLGLSGDTIAYESSATNLVAGDAGGYKDVYVVGVTQDETPPTTTDDAPAGWTNAASVTVSLTATDTLSGVAATYARQGMASVGTYTAPFVISAEGATQIDYFSIDVARNVEATQTATVRIDRTAPTATDDAPADWVNAETTVTISGSDALSGPAAAYSSLNGAAEVMGFGVLVTAEGTNVIDYRVVDAAGNSSTTETASVRLDMTPPVTTSDAQSDYTDSATIALTATDALSGVNATWVSLDGAPFAAYTEPVEVTDAGQHTLAFYSVDNAGNTEAESTVTFEVTVQEADAELPLTGGSLALLIMFAAGSAATGSGLRFGLGRR